MVKYMTFNHYNMSSSLIGLIFILIVNYKLCIYVHTQAAIS